MAAKTPSDFAPTFSGCFDTGDLPGILDLYAEEIVAVPEPGARLHGKAQLQAGLEAFAAMAPFTMKFTQAGLVEGAETALIFGDWVFDGTSPDGPVHIEARATIVLQQRSDGWYAVLDDFFSAG
jgi:ketosteroid isomerase-like protein